MTNQRLIRRARIPTKGRAMLVAVVTHWLRCKPSPQRAPSFKLQRAWKSTDDGSGAGIRGCEKSDGGCFKRQFRLWRHLHESWVTAFVDQNPVLLLIMRKRGCTLLWPRGGRCSRWLVKSRAATFCEVWVNRCADGTHRRSLSRVESLM